MHREPEKRWWNITYFLTGEYSTVKAKKHSLLMMGFVGRKREQRFFQSKSEFFCSTSIEQQSSYFEIHICNHVICALSFTHTEDSCSSVPTVEYSIMWLILFIILFLMDIWTASNILGWGDTTVYWIGGPNKQDLDWHFTVYDTEWAGHRSDLCYSGEEATMYRGRTVFQFLTTISVHVF